MSKWVFENYQGMQTYYPKYVIDSIQKLVQDTINKRPHSDNTIFEQILKIIEDEE